MLDEARSAGKLNEDAWTNGHRSDSPAKAARRWLATCRLLGRSPHAGNSPWSPPYVVTSWGAVYGGQYAEGLGLSDKQVAERVTE